MKRTRLSGQLQLIRHAMTCSFNLAPLRHDIILHRGPPEYITDGAGCIKLNIFIAVFDGALGDTVWLSIGVFYPFSLLSLTGALHY